VLEPGGEAFRDVAARWPDVVAGGRIDRSRLAEVVFSDADSLRSLEAITHPAIGRRVAAAVRAATGTPLVIVEIPLLKDLLGEGWPVVVVDAPGEIRRLRLVARGMDPADVERRMAVQPGRSEWLAAADLVIDNGAGPDALREECRRVWEHVVGRRPGGVLPGESR
jgi:dephospho-CoA kinase